MKKILTFIAAAVFCLACNKTPQDDQPDYGLEIEILDLHSSHCKVRVTPDDPDMLYFLGVSLKDHFIENYGSLDDMKQAVGNFIETQIIMNSEVPVRDLLHKGTYERDVTGLQPDEEFIVFACFTGEFGDIVSDVEYIVDTAPPVTESMNSFNIEIEQITATNATVFVTPSNDDDYVCFEMPEFVYADKTTEELEAFLIKNYSTFFPSYTYRGEIMHSFDNKLDPDTEYMIIVFGYDGGITTPLTTKKFRTKEPNDPTNVTFNIEVRELTARNAAITFTPSDNSVSYLAIVADEDLLKAYGGGNPNGVKLLIDMEIQQSIMVGDCSDRAEFAKYYAKRGEQTGNFSLIPESKHYACAVCVDKDGKYASEIAIVEFTAPKGAETDAAVTMTFSKYFDGDALAAHDASLYGDYLGSAVLPVNFALAGSAADAIYTVIPTANIEKEGATDDDIREILINKDFLGTYTFFIQEKEIIQLDWNCEYKIFAVAYDAGDNFGKIVSATIPAMTREGASPVTEF